jgi:hypothetical protein
VRPKYAQLMAEIKLNIGKGEARNERSQRKCKI